jgi:predicted dehydrogenase
MRKVVFAGCGGITRAWMSAVKDFEDVQIVGLCDLDLSRTEEFAEKWNVADAVRGADLEKVIGESGADTVFDCTVPAAHKTVTVTALKAGCDVLGEKPMAESMADAREMRDTARKTGKTYAVIQNRRYNPQIIRYRDSLLSGSAGDLTTLNADFYIGAHFGGFRAEMDHVLLLDMAIHSFDEARFISGLDPVSVYAHEWNPKGSWYDHGANAVAIFEMAGGVVFTYRGSWCSEGLNTSWECDWRGVCVNGTIAWDGADTVTGEIEAGGENLIHDFKPLTIPPVPDIPHQRHGGVIREFLDCLDAGTKPQTDCTDNIKSIAMVLGAVESAETGRKVSIEI